MQLFMLNVDRVLKECIIGGPISDKAGNTGSASFDVHGGSLATLFIM
ncbi:MAG: hypothetical protein ACD_28C00204G0004 [uncultured bacterium]|nr:MAG: hypothetical protein ACD_28C00204G0004 [uncultured bacterium]KKT74981.1 MAG: hypothetical protein UW70_C0041G0004 [Candidatus Peregrinibacteria bacterium GW2011_GWA2_44_7]